MRISTSTMLQQTSQSDKVQNDLTKTMHKLSSGKRINSASDDAAGLAIAKRLEAMSRGYKTAGDNIDYAINALNIADSGSSSVSDILQRQSELATQASSDTLTDSDRQALNKEYQSLNEELARTTESTQYNNMDLINGQSDLSDGSGTVQSGASATDQTELPATDLTGATSSSGDISTAAGAQAALQSVSQSLESVSATRASIGATVNTLEHESNINRVMEIYNTDAESRIEDLDYAQGVMDLARQELLNQTATDAKKNFNQITKHTVLGLLQ
ncbi:MAG TPA: flagellin [Fibrobacteraceae bacterium]|nr:flagellin [Fibrobacteraceae bacterium]